MRRREFLEGAVGASLAAALGPLACGPPAPPPDDGWDPGPLRHLLPAVGPDRIRVKASFRSPPEGAPRLVAGAHAARAAATDRAGLFWHFDLTGLEPGRRHELRLLDAAGRPLCDPWPLSTFPAPDARPAGFRLLAYTCAGGPDLLHFRHTGYGFLPLEVRRRLLARALSFEPDALLANGDHVYWDLRGRHAWTLGRAWEARLCAGTFERSRPVLGTPNEDVLVRAFAPQIADLYGVRLRSLPVFFLRDDHDYTENDEATQDLRTFPPDAFMRDVARATQALFYPELPAADGGWAERYGTLRYGALCEALLYDCRGALANDRDPAEPADAGWFVPPPVERWLAGRTARSDAAHVVHVPSTPFLWTAGKWGEWYPDATDEDGRLRADAPKPWWSPDWLAQHDRLLAAASARRDRTPLFASGDLHASAAGRILRSGGLRLDANPPVSLLCGTLGTARGGFPSSARGQRARPSGVLDVEEWVEPIEENGFSLLDFEPGRLTASLFRWKPGDGLDAIDRLEPFRRIEIR